MAARKDMAPLMFFAFIERLSFPLPFFRSDRSGVTTCSSIPACKAGQIDELLSLDVGPKQGQELGIVNYRA